jgi:predicted transcriptional regulator of viral defense system
MARVRQRINRIGAFAAGRSERSRLDLAVAALAAGQHGVVSVTQLLEAGLTHRMIQRRVACGWLHRVHHGVYAVGHPNISREGHWMAATLACGRGAVLSHRSAAALLSLRESGATRIDVSCPGRVGRSRRGIAVHSGDFLLSSDVCVVSSIPCTTVERTIFDLSAILNRDALEYALHRAQVRASPLDFGELRTLLDRFDGQPGTARLRSLLGRPPELSDAEAKSRIEREFLALCRRAGLPRPRVNAWIALPIPAGGLEVDFTWPDHMLAVETDTSAFHGTSRANRNDPARDRALTLAGWQVVRFAWWDVMAEPTRVASEVGALLAG